MGLSFTKVVISLLTITQTLCTAQIYRHPHAQPNAVLATNLSSYVAADQGNATYGDKHALPVKRAPPACQMQPLGGPWGTTMVDAIAEPANLGWKRNDMYRLAREGYEQVVAATQQPNNLVAALWIPERGVYLGSIPHDGGQTAFSQNAPTSAPRLWGLIEDRTRDFRGGATGSESIYHAEDMAMYWFEDRQQPQVITGHYPEFSFMAVYGKKATDAQLSNQQPCTGIYARIIPNCRSVLNILDIAHAR
jgi:hypothetical protein